MTRYHSFNPTMIEQAMASARAHSEILSPEESGQADAQPTPLLVKADCAEMEAKEGEICIALPFGLGRLCLDLPGADARATVRAFLDIYAVAGEPTGAKITLCREEQVILRRIVVSG